MASFAVQAGEDTLLVDPLLPAEPEPVLGLIERILGGRLSILITIPYHVRSAEELARRFGGRIYGHAACAKRVRRKVRPLEDLPAGVTAHRIGRPRRYETPLLLPSHGALVFGDAVVEHGGRLRVWAHDPIDAKVERFYRERFNPTLEPLLELDLDRVLVTHGEPVLKDGRKKLRAALRAKPWYHRG